jgi:hypothetical protein
MTIDEAIKYADMLSCNVNAFEVSKQFGAMCADALRLAKKMSEDAGISATPVQDTWQERMKREYRETKERYEKLHRMVTKYEDGTLNFTPNCSIDLLKQQKRHMGEYLHDLEIRAEIEGVNLYD